MNNISNSNLYDDIKEILNFTKKKAIKAVNNSMVEAYWNIGRLIVEFQDGNDFSEYRSRLLDDLSKRLTDEFGSGFDKSNLSRMRKFHLLYRNLDTVCQDLTWSHYRALLKVESADARKFYEEECLKASWSVRELSRQINSFYYERLIASQDKDAVESNMLISSEELHPTQVIKDPYVLEFLGINKFEKLYELDLEKQLINHLQEFLLELGRGFSFVGRQKRFHIDGEDFFIDLVFYNYILKCFVLIDLKVGELKHQDIGQMQMYVNYYTRELMNEGDNLPIGIVLCADKSEAVVKYTLPEDNKQIFASKYMLYIPTEEEFKNEIQREREVIELEKELSDK